MITRKSALQPIELPNGASVVCRHCFLAIANRSSVWLHVFNRERLCNPANPARSYAAQPYILP